MDIEKNEYFDAKKYFCQRLEYREKIEGELSEAVIARLHCDDVENNNDEYSDIISELLFQKELIEKTGYTSYLSALTRAITQFDNGFDFTVLNDEEYADLKLIVEKLKDYLAEQNAIR
ncbi:MAG: hypothetical protein E7497_01315 [Ruminococcus sp.]|nr:hypothetical protein [Ruminococcus sp.]